MDKMAVQSKALPAVTTARRRYFVWAQIIVAFLFLEFALWAPTTAIRNRSGSIAMITIVVLVLSDVLSGRSSLKRLGIGLPTTFGATVMLGIGMATVVFMMTVVDCLGGQIPANPAGWPNLLLAWGYVLWALIQQFMLQSFFFNRFEDLYGSSAAVWMASTIFAAAHLPSPILTTATLVGALFFCEMFRRYRSIYPLAIVHATLGLTIGLVTPDSLLHHMRVGIGYLRY
jgi:membrane protease YdiL (CAAX protease family)